MKATVSSTPAALKVESRKAASPPVSHGPAKRSRFGLAWLSVCMLLAGYLAFGRSTPLPDSPQQAVNQPTTAAAAAPHAPRLKPIEQIRVGERVLGENPLGEEDDQLGDDVDPASWRKLVLRAPKEDGGWADVELLRPDWWLEEQGAERGGQVEISVPECGIDGSAQVLDIEPCPPILPGKGHIVTGTFAHSAAAIIDLYIEGLESPIGATGNHPFWSEDRKDFVRADQLAVGEQLLTAHARRRLVRTSTRSGQAPVYNLEVAVEHVYCVSNHGVLVHNGKLCPVVLGENMAERVNPVVAALKAGGTPVRSYKARGPFKPFWVRNQQQWIRRQIRSGRKIYDIGLDPNRTAKKRATQPYYGIEVKTLEKNGYRRVFRRGIFVDGQMFDLYEWVPFH